MKLLKLYLIVNIFFLSKCTSKEANNIDHPIYFQKVIDSAYKITYRDDISLSFDYLDAEYAKFKNAGIGDRWKRLYFKQNAYYNSYRLNKKPKYLIESSSYLDSMFLLLEAEKNTDKYHLELCYTNFAKGDVLFEKKQFQLAYNYFHKGKLIADRTLTKCEQAIFDTRFAQLNYSQKKYRRAVIFYMSAYRNDLTCKLNFENFTVTQGAITNAGLSYAKLKQPDSALICYNMALDHIEKNEALFKHKITAVNVRKGLIYHYIASIYLEQGNYELAEKYLKMCLFYNENKGTEQKNAQIANLKLGRIYLERGDFQSVKLLLEKLRQQINANPNDMAEKDWQLLMFNYLMLANRPTEAEMHMVKYQNLKNEYDEYEKELLEADVGEEFYNLRKEYENNILKKENQLKESYLILTIGIAALSILLIIILQKNFKNSSKNNKALEEFSKQLIEQNERLHETLEALEASDKENTRVMQIITHDLRSPMAAIVGLSSFMIDEHNLREEDLEVIDLINSSGKDSLNFITEILNKQTTGKDIIKEKIDLNLLINYCVTQLSFKAKEKQQKISYKGIKVETSINREKIWRVLSNLITNAIKFSANHSVIDVKLYVNQKKAIISIKDEGIGIPVELQHKIFINTNENKREGTNGEKSFGLGLAISKQIIEAHSGELNFESVENKGTTFYLTLPII